MPVKNTASPRSVSLWVLALTVALLGAWIMYDAEPGINWGLWTLAASLGLVLIVRLRGGIPGRPGLLMLIAAVVLAAGASITAAPIVAALICLSVMTLLSLAMLLVLRSNPRTLTLVYAVSGPFVAAGNALAESVRRFGDLSRAIRSPRARAIVRGVIFTLPVVVIFALLLSSADPLFANWREAIARLLSSWEFVPRVVFFFALLVVVLGAYGYALRAPGNDNLIVSADASTGRKTAILGATERLILLSAVALLFWIFLAVQVSYLFGNAPTVVGSGITFADYARRGFGEITIVATMSVGLVVFAESYGEPAGQSAGYLRGVTLILVAAVMLLLVSAFRRVSLYEQAYGFTVPRLYAQAYMLVMAIAIVGLAREVVAGIDTGRLFRITAAAAVLAFATLVYWNHEGWIASQNIRRFATTGKLDTVYLTRDLSPDAIPAIVRELPRLPAPVATSIRASLASTYARRRFLWRERWYEWNLGRARARKALRLIGIAEPLRTATD